MKYTESEYKKWIGEMLDRIKNPKDLKRILHYICRLYVNSPD